MPKIKKPEPEKAIPATLTEQEQFQALKIKCDTLKFQEQEQNNINIQLAKENAELKKALQEAHAFNGQVLMSYNNSNLSPDIMKNIEKWIEARFKAELSPITKENKQTIDCLKENSIIMLDRTDKQIANLTNQFNSLEKDIVECKNSMLKFVNIAQNMSQKLTENIRIHNALSNNKRTIQIMDGD